VDSPLSPSTSPAPAGGGPWDGTEGNPWALDALAPPGGAPLRWLRGNLHCHTTASDGRLSPQATAEWFRGAGYDFLALTDHNTVVDPAAVDAGGLCLIPATELTAAGGALGGSYHLVALGLEPGIGLPPPATPAPQSAAWLRRQGAVVFVAHPVWSGLTVDDLLAVPAHGIEAYNGGTVLDSQKGEALAHWDEGLARGARWWGLATDDTHWHTVDRGTGWVVVRAPEATPAALLGALARGHFYATSGPELRRVSLHPEADGGVTLEAETSPCAAIYALGFGPHNQFVFDPRAGAGRAAAGAPEARGAREGWTVERATFRLRPERLPGRYVRVQCVDWQRRAAWSNPLFL
jgi:predicted metal-dependent phosphoesterase TrpH